MEVRPKIQPSLTTTDKVFELLGWLVIVATWVLAIYIYTTLPAIVPTHYDGMGEVNDHGSKSTLFTLPLIATVMFIGLTILNRFPHIFNYPAPINANNAHTQYTIATRLIRYIKFIMAITFGAITFRTIQNATGNAQGLGVWFLPAVLAFNFIPIIYYIVKMSRKV